MQDGDTYEEIMKCLSCRYPRCTNCLEYALSRRSPRLKQGTIFSNSRILRLYESGLGDTEIAERLGCHRHTVYRWRLRNELPPNPSPRSKKEVLP